MKLTKREKILIMIFCIFTSIYGYYSLFIKPSIQKIRVLETNKRKYETLLETKESKIEKSPIFDQKFKILNKKILDLSSSYFPSIIQEQCILILDDMIQKSNIQIQSIAFREPKINTIKPTNQESEEETGEYLLKQLANAYLGKPSLKKQTHNLDKNNETMLVEEDIKAQIENMEVTLLAEGNYFDICNFIDNISQANQKINIKNICLTRKEDAWISADIILNFYSIPMLKDGEPNIEKWPFEQECGKDDPFNSDIE